MVLFAWSALALGSTVDVLSQDGLVAGLNAGTIDPALIWEEGARPGGAFARSLRPQSAGDLSAFAATQPDIIAAEVDLRGPTVPVTGAWVTTWRGDAPTRFIRIWLPRTDDGQTPARDLVATVDGVAAAFSRGPDCLDIKLEADWAPGQRHVVGLSLNLEVPERPPSDPDKSTSTNHAWANEPRVERGNGWTVLPGGLPTIAGLHMGAWADCEAPAFAPRAASPASLAVIQARSPIPMLLVGTGTELARVVRDEARRTTLVAAGARTFGLGWVDPERWAAEDAEFAGSRVRIWRPREYSWAAKSFAELGRAALRVFGNLYGALPAREIEVVIVRPGPTLTGTVDQFVAFPLRTAREKGLIEEVFVRAMARQWIDGAVATDPLATPWVHEGLVSWSALALIERVRGPDVARLAFPRKVGRLSEAPYRDQQANGSFWDYDRDAFTPVLGGRGARLWPALAQALGDKVLRDTLHREFVAARWGRLSTETLVDALVALNPPKVNALLQQEIVQTGGANLGAPPARGFQIDDGGSLTVPEVSLDARAMKLPVAATDRRCVVAFRAGENGQTEEIAVTGCEEPWSTAVREKARRAIPRMPTGLLVEAQQLWRVAMSPSSAGMLGEGLRTVEGDYNDPDFVVRWLQPGGPADLAGIKQNEAITLVDGQQIAPLMPLDAWIRGHEAGELPVEYRRLDGWVKPKTLTLVPRGDDQRLIGQKFAIRGVDPRSGAVLSRSGVGVALVWNPWTKDAHEMVGLTEELAERGLPAVLLSLAERDVSRVFLMEHGIRLPVVGPDPSWLDPIQPDGEPLLIGWDADGVVRWVHAGPIDLDPIRASLEKALGVQLADEP